MHRAIQADDIIRVHHQSLIDLHLPARHMALRPGDIRAPLQGQHPSRFKGLGMELMEVRPYQHGDDLYSIDWRVTARTGTPHTKVFREERERPVLLWTDLRHGMFFGTRNCYKSVLAAKTAALLAWCAVQHGDRAGGLIFSESLQQESRPMRGDKGALSFIGKLGNHPAWTQTHDRPALQHSDNSISTSLHALQRCARHGSLIFLLSDFNDFDASHHGQLHALSRHNDVILIHISDPMEQQLPANGIYRFSNGYETLAIGTFDSRALARYRQWFQQRQQQLQDLCHQTGCTYLPLDTRDDPVTCLRRHLGLHD